MTTAQIQQPKPKTEASSQQNASHCSQADARKKTELKPLEPSSQQQAATNSRQKIELSKTQQTTQKVASTTPSPQAAGKTKISQQKATGKTTVSQQTFHQPRRLIK